ncbi:ABC transporter ATP-binding protein [Nonomuraea sp. NPDC050404]|uniref:ABC transporter ATP-binding protein n=1 Tax=Nonomuraea sp. NPDC050404 TaxID=3155783 RepID=UPI0033FDB7F7
MTAILTTRLSKSYGEVSAVHDLDLRIGTGQIYGLLGLNGAGKTTVMRMLLGLARPSSGEARVLGHPPGHRSLTGRIGALVEQPAFYPWLSGRENLALVARYSNLSEKLATVALERVELDGKAHARFRTYSLGMKQRLGVAAALLGDPELLVLDEPTNGLDPEGMAGIRGLIRSLGAAGRTVVLSSHLLGEVEQVCDRVAVVHTGRLVAEGTVEDIRNSVGGSRVVIEVDSAEAALACLSSVPGVTILRTEGDRIELTSADAPPRTLNRLLVSNQVEVSELRTVRGSLEEAFLGLTSTRPVEAELEAAS